MGPGLKVEEAPTEPLDLGQGHTLKLFAFKSLTPDEIVGGWWEHDDPDLHLRCTGLIYFDVAATGHVDKEKYLVKSWEPLTMGKRIQCCHCLTAGHIKEGLWRPYGGRHE